MISSGFLAFWVWNWVFCGDLGGLEVPLRLFGFRGFRVLWFWGVAWVFELFVVVIIVFWVVVFGFCFCRCFVVWWFGVWWCPVVLGLLFGFGLGFCVVVGGFGFWDSLR